MIGLFRRVLEASEVHRRRRRAKLDASPRSTVELCRILLRQGRIKAACDVAKDGLQRFPNSAEIRDILHSTWQRSSRKEVAELEAKVREEPSVDNYLALVEHLQQFGENERAATACQEMVERHPNDPRAALAGGRALLARFHRDHVAQDGALGLKSLQRAAELDPSNFDAHFELAQTHYYIGAVSKALFWLYKALDLRSDHGEANRLYRILVRLPLEKQEQTELLREIEANDEVHFSYDPETTEGPGDGVVALNQRLEQLSMLAGVRRVVLSHRGLDAVAQEGRRVEEHNDEQRCLLDLAKGFRRTASLSAKRMGIGAFEEAEMAWKGGTMLALGTGRTILMVEIDGGAQRVATVAEEARNFVAGSAKVAQPSGEPAHA